LSYERFFPAGPPDRVVVARDGKENSYLRMGQQKYRGCRIYFMAGAGEGAVSAGDGVVELAS